MSFIFSHRLPVWDSALLKKWLAALKLKEWNLSEPYYVCSLHFTPESCIGGLLRDDAVPTAIAAGNQQFQGQNEIIVNPDYPLKNEVSAYVL